MKRTLKMSLLSIALLLTSLSNVSAQLKLDNYQKVIVGNGAAVGGNKLTVHGDSYVSGTTNLYKLNVANLSSFNNIASFYSSGVFHGGATFSSDVYLNRKTDFNGVANFKSDVNTYDDLIAHGTFTPKGNVNFSNARINGITNVTDYARFNSKAYIGNVNSSGIPTLTIAGGTENLYSVYAHGHYLGSGYYTSSDKRLKKDITDIDNALEKLGKISGKSYNFKTKEELKSLDWGVKQEYDTIYYIDENGKKSNKLIERYPQPTGRKGRAYGVIAQDVATTLPELIEFDSLTGTYAVDYQGLIPILIEGVKEQQVQIKSLEDQAKEHKEELEQQEKDIAELKKEVEMLKTNKGIKSAAILPNVQQASLKQNYPNPFNKETVIGFYLPGEVLTANIYIYDLQGKQLKSINITQRGNGSITIYANELMPGMYKYALVADGEIAGTETMILSE